MSDRWRRFRHVHESDPHTEVRDELAFHLEMRARDLRARGLSEEAARREAERRLGDLTIVAARCESEAVRLYRKRRLREASMSIVRDFIHAGRALGRRPFFLAGACVVLALGIGATTAVYSMVDAVLLAPLPYRAPSELVLVRTLDDKGEEQPLALEARERIRAAGGAFADIAGYGGGTRILSGIGDPEEIEIGRIEHHLFDVLGATPALGRAFGEEHRPDGGTDNVVILSWRLWQRRFGGDPSAIGRTIQLQEQSHEIIGVMPAGFEFPVGSRVEAWLPLVRASIDELLRHTPVENAVARLTPQRNLAQATAQASTIVSQVAATGTDAFGEALVPAGAPPWSARVVPVREAMLVSDQALVLLLAAVALLLVIACANVANLFLVRGSERRAELAVRAALGGGRFDLAMPTLLEVGIVCAIGAALGLLWAQWAVQALSQLDPGGLPRWEGIALNDRAWAAAAAATGGAGILCALLPARAAARTSPGDALRTGARSSETRARLRLRDAVVAVEVGLVFVLLVGAGLLLRSFAAVREVDTGFELETVVTGRVVLPAARYGNRNEGVAAAFYRDVLDRLRAHPRVLAAGAVSAAPMSEGGIEMTGELASPVTGETAVGGRLLFATPDYFRTVGMPIRGRDFTTADRRGTQRVVVFNEAMARHMYPGQDALGQRFRHGPGESEVIGIVPDVRDDGPEQEAVPTYYAAEAQFGWLPGMVLAVRTRGDATSFGRTLVDIIHEVDAALPVADVRTLAQSRDGVLARRRFDSVMLTAIALAALILAAAGVFSVTANAVAQRRHEMGIRRALGARSNDIARLVLRHTIRVTAIGALGGAVAAVIAVRSLRAVLFGVAPTDPLTFAVAAGTLAAMAIVAALVPARRATRTDPVDALRAG